MNTPAIETAIYHNGRTHAEHCAWVDSLTGDEYRIVHMPIGHRFNMAEVSLIKRHLVMFNLPVEHRLRALETIVGCVYGPVSAEAIEAIDPCCDTAAEIFRELHSLPIEKQSSAFRDGDLFRILAKLNPSLLTALQLCQWHPPVPERNN